MNIFYLDKDIKKCARAHCDKHVIKMILESAQILCTVCNLQGIKTPYRKTHVHHPCVIWAGKSLDNWLWLKKLALALNQEYRYRYDKNKDHRSIGVIRCLKRPKLRHLGITTRPQAMPKKYQKKGHAVAAYRAYYKGMKRRIATWKKRPIPRWFLTK